MLLAACPAVFNAPADFPEVPAGMGIINLNLYGSNTRAILPEEAADFVYKVVFSVADTDIEVEADFEDGKVLQVLPFNIWNITVYAYYEDIDEELVLVGKAELDPVTLSPANLQPTVDGIVVFIKPFGANGYLAYDITFPDGLDSAVLYITKSDDPDFVPIVIDLEDIGDDENPLSLAPGSYRFRVELKVDDPVARTGDFEIVHIYPTLTSTVIMTFCEISLFTPPPSDIKVDPTIDTTKATVYLSLDKDDFSEELDELLEVVILTTVYIQAVPVDPFEIKGTPSITYDDGTGTKTIFAVSVPGIDNVYSFEMIASESDLIVSVEFMERVELDAGDSDDVDYDDITAQVTFTGADGLSLSIVDFEVDKDAEIDAVDVEGDTVTVTVTLPVNTSVLAKIYTVSIADTSAVVMGDATVTITQSGTVYTLALPMMDFEDIDVGAFTGGDYWTTGSNVAINPDPYTGNRVGLSVKANPREEGNPSDNVLEFEVPDQGGQRFLQLNFTNATDSVVNSNSRHGIAFDWKPSPAANRPTNANLGYLGILDGTATSPVSNQFIAFYLTNAHGLRYSVTSSNLANEAAYIDTLEDNIPTGITAAAFNVWYRFVVIIDTDAKTIDLTIINLETEELVIEELNIPFATGIDYSPKIAALRLTGVRNGTNNTWPTHLDNIELFRLGEPGDNGGNGYDEVPITLGPGGIFAENWADTAGGFANDNTEVFATNPDGNAKLSLAAVDWVIYDASAFAGFTFMYKSQGTTSFVIKVADSMYGTSYNNLPPAADWTPYTMMFTDMDRLHGTDDPTFNPALIAEFNFETWGGSPNRIDVKDIKGLVAK
jgi:hypothetical protein